MQTGFFLRSATSRTRRTSSLAYFSPPSTGTKEGWPRGGSPRKARTLSIPESRISSTAREVAPKGRAFVDPGTEDPPAGAGEILAGRAYAGDVGHRLDLELVLDPRPHLQGAAAGRPAGAPGHADEGGTERTKRAHRLEE